MTSLSDIKRGGREERKKGGEGGEEVGVMELRWLDR